MNRGQRARSSWRRWIIATAIMTPLGVVAVGTLGPVVTHADDTPVLHEFVPDVRAAEMAIVAGAGEMPAAIVYEGEVLSRPEATPRRAGERAMRAGEGSIHGEGTRARTFRPDRVTSLDGTLGYSSVFTPSIAPFKRVTSLDRIVEVRGNVPVLGSASDERTPVPIEGVQGAAGTQADGRDHFWGNVLLDFSSGYEAPFPSVSPDSRLLSLRVEPEVDLRITQDDAGNFYARSVQAHAERQEVRVVFLMDAPQGYFAAETIPEVPADILAARVPPVPRRVRADALTFANELGIAPTDSLRAVLRRLTAHFRSFVESDEPPPNTGNIYLDLARAGRGVCRHRTYAFVITAQALGIPARFVHNEAHAWAEVRLPDGWMRVDLGGAAGGLRERNQQRRPQYRPFYDDPLPRPPAYARTAGNTLGTGPAMSSSLSSSFGDTPRGPSASTSGASGVLGTGSVGGATGAGYTTSGANSNSSASNESTDAFRRPLQLLLDENQLEGIRGRTLMLSGRALSPDNQGVADLRVEVLVRGVPGGAEGTRPAAGERLLGVTVTTDDGSFRLPLGIPVDLGVGDYTLIVRSPGNGTFLPAEAR